MNLLGIIADRDLDKIMTEKIDQFQGQIIGENEGFLLFAEIYAFNEFEYLKLRLLGPLKVQTFDGCQITFFSDQGELGMESDTMEIDTDYSKKLKVGITEFDFDLEDELIDVIENQKISSVQISIRKSKLDIPITNQNLLKSLMKIEG